MARAETGVELAQQATDVDAVLAREMAGGWVVNPTFRAWTPGGNPQNWGVEGAAHITKNSGGWLYDTAAKLAAPGSTNVYVSARHGAAGQLNARATLKTEWIVVSAIVEYVSGDLASGYLAQQWRTAAGSYISGTLPLSSGYQLDTIFRAETDTRQAVQLLFKRPASVSEAATADMRVVLWAGQSAKTAGLTVVVHALDCRAATEQEIDQTKLRAYAYADAAVSTQSTTFSGLLAAQATRIDTVETRMGSAEAAITATDLARANGDSALAVRMTTVEARANDGNLCLNPEGARLNADGTPADFSSWPTGWSAVARAAGDGSTAMANCPSTSALKLPADATTNRQSIVAGLGARISVKTGERFVAAYDWATGGAGGGSVTVGLRARWYNADGGDIGTTGLWITDANSGAWQSASREITVPANAASMRVELTRTAGGTGNAYVTNLRFARRDAGLAGRLDAVIAFRADAGNPAELQLISTSTDGLATSTAKIRADNILLDGTVAARHLVVGDFANLVPDDQLQDLGSWAQNVGTWTCYPTSGLSTAASVGEMRTPSASTNALLLSEMFPVEPGEVYAFSFQCRRSGGTKMSCALRIYWYDNDGTFISSGNAAEYSGTSAATLTRSGTLTAPSTASYAKAGFLVIAADTDSTVRFLAPKARRQLNAVEIKDGAIVADKLSANSVVADKIQVGAVVSAKIAAGAIVAEKITAGAIETSHIAAAAITAGKIATDAITAAKIAANAITTDKIVAGTIETDRIKVGAVGKTFSGTSFASTSLDSTDKTLLSWTMPSSVPASSALQIIFSLGYDTKNGPNTTFKVKKNGTTMFENSTNNNGSDTDRTMTYSTVITVADGDVITITGTKGSGSATMQFIRASLLVVMR